MNSTIILIHGLGANWKAGWSMIPLQYYLKCSARYKNVYIVTYPVDNEEFDVCLDIVDKKISELVDKENDDIIVIGHSFGGLIANHLHTKGWGERIKMAIYIGSPLRGARIITQVEEKIPLRVADALRKIPYEYLKTKPDEKVPPHPYRTISMGWFWTTFDHCVYTDEAVLEKDNHIHLPWADHVTIFFNPRLWLLIKTLI